MGIGCAGWVVDTGLGPRSEAKVLAFAAEYAQGRRLYLTTTHFHPTARAISTSAAGSSSCGPPARAIAVMQRLIGERPRIVVPGHGDIGGLELLAEVRDYLAELRGRNLAAAGLGHE